MQIHMYMQRAAYICISTQAKINAYCKCSFSEKSRASTMKNYKGFVLNLQFLGEVLYKYAHIIHAL